MDAHDVGSIGYAHHLPGDVLFGIVCNEMILTVVDFHSDCLPVLLDTSREWLANETTFFNNPPTLMPPLDEGLSISEYGPGKRWSCAPARDTVTPLSGPGFHSSKRS